MVVHDDQKRSLRVPLVTSISQSDAVDRHANSPNGDTSLLTGGHRALSGPDEHAARESVARCLIDREFIKHVPQVERIAYVCNPDDDYDIIIAGSATAHTYADFIVRCSNPAAPMIAFSGALGPRADVVLRDASASSISAAISHLQPLVRALAALPPITRSIDRYGLLALCLAYTRECSIDARWQPHDRRLIGYPMLLGIDNPRSVLEEMSEAGLMRRRFAERLYLCGRCNSSRVHVREVCVSCKSSYLHEHQLIHHYRCAFQAPQQQFETANGYTCPKCGKRLRHYGVDYDKPGVIVTCGSCGDHFAEPQVGFTCLDCNSYTAGDHADQLDWYHYDLLPDGVATLRVGQLPHPGIEEPMTGACSLRDFRLYLSRAVPAATRHRRPLIAWKANLDFGDLREQVGPRAMAETCRLVRDLVVQTLDEGDLVAALPTGVVVCLPERTRANADIIVHGTLEKISETVKPRVKISATLYERDQISSLLQELN